MNKLEVSYRIHQWQHDCPVCQENIRSVACYDNTGEPVPGDYYPDMARVDFAWHWENVGWDCGHAYKVGV